MRDQEWRARWDVLYSGEAGGLVYHLRADGFMLQLIRQEEVEEEVEEGEACHGPWEKEECHRLEIYRVDVDFVGCKVPRIRAERELSSYENFYNVPVGVEPALFVRRYERVEYEEVWEGVNIAFYCGKDGQLEWDFKVDRGVDVSVVRLRLHGARVVVREGRLVLSTPFGEVVSSEPKAWAGGHTLRCGWLVDGNEVGFWVEGRKLDEPLYIDPTVQRLWGTYYGGEDHEEPGGICMDSDGNIYFAGSTPSLTQIATTGAHQTSMEGFTDALLAKFSYVGSLSWATYYGGFWNELGNSCAVSRDGWVYLVGFTLTSHTVCPSCIATPGVPGVHQVSYNGDGDAFVVKFSSSGVRVWGSYYGGPGEDFFNCVAVDDDGFVYIAGTTKSSHLLCPDCIATPNIPTIPQSTYGGGWSDAFLVKFSPTGARVWGTYYGGSGWEMGLSCAVEGSVAVYLSGFTTTGDNSCTNCIATVGSHQSSHGGNEDAFLVKFSFSGERLWGTYYGGSLGDRGLACAVDASGNVYLAGSTSTNCVSCISTPGVPTIHQGTIGGGNDAFLVKFSSSGTRIWGTYYGGDDNDEGLACAVDEAGGVYLAGFTTSFSGIATPGAHQQTISMFVEDLPDAFVAKFSGSNGNLVWGTYYGGEFRDYAYGVAPLSPYHVFLAGATYSAGGPGPISSSAVSPGVPHQVYHGGGEEDLFLALLCEEGGSGCAPLVRDGTEAKDDLLPWHMEFFSITQGKWVKIQALQAVNIELYDLQGRILRKWHLQAGEMRYEKLEGLANGLYFIRDEHGARVERIIVLP